MVEAGEDAHDERFSLAMVLLIETIFLHRYSKAMFPTSNLQKVQHMDVFLNHHWGIDAYEMLLKSVKKTVENNIEKSKYPLDGFPFALHLWILEYVPKLQSAFSTIDNTLPPTAFLCVKYLHTTSPPIKSVLSIEGESNVSVVYILPKIHGDLEDTVFLQDKDDENLHSLVDLLDKGFELTHDHWRRGVLKRDDALQYIASQSYRYPHSERARQNSRPSSSDESVEAKINKLMEMFVDGQTHIHSRLSKIEQKLGIHDPSDSIDGELTPVDVSTGLNATGSRRNVSLNQMNQNVAERRRKSQRVPQTQIGKDKVSIPLDQERRQSQRGPQAQMGKNKTSIPLDKQTIVCGLVAGKAAPAKGITGTSPKPYLTEDALVEVSGEDNKWFPDSLINRQLGLGPIRTYYLKFLSLGKYKNVQEMRIRPTPPPLPEADYSTDVLALTQDVDAYHDNHWCRGYVQALLDGPEKNAETSALPTRVENISEEIRDQANVNDQELKEDSPDEIIRSVISAYTVSENDDGNDGMNENETQTKELKTKKTVKRPHNEDDLLANKKKKKGEEKSEKSKKESAQVAEQCTATVDPFQSPKTDQLTAYKEWLEKGETARIGDMDATATLFQNMENPEARFRDTEINAVLIMLQKKREEDDAYFNNDKFPRAAFCKTDFFYELLQCHDKFERYRTKLPFPDSVTNIVKGTVFPHKKWKKDVDVVYGVIKFMVPYWIGVEINFKSCQVESFSCNSQWEKKGVVLDIVRRIADMIPTLLGIAENKKPKRHLEPFKVVHHTEEEFSLSNIGFWVTDCPVYIIKMIECRSLGGNDFSKVAHMSVADMKTKYVCDIFEQFVNNKNNMEDSQPSTLIALPKLHYEFGKEPRKNFKAIDQHSKTSFIKQVEEIMGEVQFNRIRNSFLGPLLKLSSKKMLMAEKDAYDEKFSLEMLVLIESLLFGRYKEYKFPRSFIERAQDMNTLMNYHWGREAYELLLSSIKSKVPSHLDKVKYVLQGYSFAFHLWLLESVPMLQTAFSIVSNSISSSAFLCEKYLYTTSPSINQVLTIEGSPDISISSLMLT
ncbi:unnamed protein product [Thlaspi arvense]|uniref:Ubiquitin-like protease family profile domain-containing protein n=1 Tax=Thlaspi arvense TaxID=13288 RepID=A0AAU9RXH5_THLAR|nr:unnamed protein product [Thlaspi arvense]